MSIQKCPTREELSSYIQGALPEDLSQSVTEHIETCVSCDATLDELERQGDSLFRGLRQPAPPLPELDSPDYQRAMEAAEAAGLGSDASVAPAVEGPSLSELGRLGEYELLMKLGEGGMGTVYKARQTRLGKIVALKVLPRNRTGSPQAVARFENEMKAVGQLSHPNIVQALDARDIEGTTVLVMEYVDGLDLAKLAKRAGDAADRRCLRIDPSDGHRAPIHLRKPPGASRHQAVKPDANAARASQDPRPRPGPARFAASPG